MERSDVGLSWLLSLLSSVWNTVKVSPLVIPRVFEHKTSLFNSLRVAVFLDLVDRDNT